MTTGQIEAYAARFNEPWGHHVLATGALDGAEARDIDLTVGGRRIASTKEGTLTLKVDEVGLKVTAEIKGPVAELLGRLDRDRLWDLTCGVRGSELTEIIIAPIEFMEISLCPTSA